MSEFMNRHGKRFGIVGGRQEIAVVDSSAAIGVGICQNDDVLVRESREGFVYGLDTWSCQVTG